MKKWIIVFAVIALFLGGVLLTSSKWEGDVTEAAADPLAQQTGAEETQVLPWAIEGDLLLFFFLAGGSTFGFIAGYSWRKLFHENGDQQVKYRREEETGRVTA